jgi:acyl-CoA thioesterase-1
VNPILLYFASGESLYGGAALLLLMVVISPWIEQRWSALLRNVGVWIGLTMIAMACPPFSFIVDAVFACIFLFWLIAWRRRRMLQGNTWSASRLASMSALLCLLVVLPGFEFLHRTMPILSGAANDHIVVIGDSISSGLSTHELSWPEIVQRTTGVEVKNLSRAGATVNDGLAMADKLVPEDQLVLIEIGGNDLLGDTPTDTFARELEKLAAKTTSPGRTILMFELPLLPQKIAYGQIQRHVAAEHGILLIPKRYFAAVLAGKNSTTDGLHLTNAGARKMADLVVQILTPVLKTQISKVPATHP